MPAILILIAIAMTACQRTGTADAIAPEEPRAQLASPGARI